MTGSVMHLLLLREVCPRVRVILVLLVVGFVLEMLR